MHICICILRLSCPPGKEFPDLNKIAEKIRDIPSIRKNISLIVLITYTRIYNKRPQGLELSDKGKADELANLKILIQSVVAGTRRACRHHAVQSLLINQSLLIFFSSLPQLCSNTPSEDSCSPPLLPTLPFL